MHSNLGQLMDLVKDQRDLTHVSLKQRFLRPFAQRHDFHYEQYYVPKNIPLEMYFLYRFNSVVPELEGITQEEFFQTQMFRFEHDLILQQITVDEWELRYILFHPLSASCIRKFVQNFNGPDHDWLHIVHPMRYPQSMFMDYKNIMGQGVNTLFLSSPQKHYLLQVGDSFTQWLQNLVSMLENGFYHVNDSGMVRTFYNLSKIYADYIEKHKMSKQSMIQKSEEVETHQLMRPLKDTYSVNISNGLLVTVQAKFETLNSTNYPSDYYLRSELFFVIQMDVLAISTFEQFGCKYEFRGLNLEITEKCFDNQREDLAADDDLKYPQTFYNKHSIQHKISHQGKFE